ncbi:hypothetical protein CDD83_11146 [Cordyceps sp. RAO-2017]|nr:hypothetical protein CDD83_11146 [Cordyceps sp. RAO-2017]
MPSRLPPGQASVSLGPLILRGSGSPCRRPRLRAAGKEGQSSEETRAAKGRAARCRAASPRHWRRIRGPTSRPRAPLGPFPCCSAPTGPRPASPPKSLPASAASSNSLKSYVLKSYLARLVLPSTCQTLPLSSQGHASSSASYLSVPTCVLHLDSPSRLPPERRPWTRAAAALTERFFVEPNIESAPFFPGPCTCCDAYCPSPRPCPRPGSGAAIVAVDRAFSLGYDPASIAELKAGSGSTCGTKAGRCRMPSASSQRHLPPPICFSQLLILLAAHGPLLHGPG